MFLLLKALVHITGRQRKRLHDLFRIQRAVGCPGSIHRDIGHPDRKEAVHGNWDSLPTGISQFGNSAEQIFSSYFDVEKKVGKEEMKNIPYGAIAMWTLADKLSCGLQQLMAGARKFSLAQVDRNDLFAANRETAVETGIRHVTDINNETALKILYG